MNQTYIVLAEYANLNGIKENKKDVYQSYITGDDVKRIQLVPSYMFERGQKFELDLSTLDTQQLENLNSKESCYAVVRLGTNYDEEAKKQGFEHSLYKIRIPSTNKIDWYNTVMPGSVINEFCQRWESEKAYILNPSYSNWSLPLMDKFYLEQIKQNQKKATK